MSTIIVAEDSEITRKMLNVGLQERGYDVLCIPMVKTSS